MIYLSGIDFSEMYHNACHFPLKNQCLSLWENGSNLLLSKQTEAGEARRHLELEKSRSDGLRLELERAQSELRAVTQHAGATELQLETEHSSTWNKLRLAQRDRDDLQVKVVSTRGENFREKEVWGKM